MPRTEADEVLDTTFLTNLFTNRKIRDIIALPNELNKRIDRYIFLYGITIPFFAYYPTISFFPLGKNVTPVGWYDKFMPICV